MVKKKNPAAVALGRKGGKKRWKKVSEQKRSEIMRQVASNPRPSRKKNAE